MKTLRSLTFIFFLMMSFSHLSANEGHRTGTRHVIGSPVRERTDEIKLHPKIKHDQVRQKKRYVNRNPKKKNQKSREAVTSHGPAFFEDDRVDHEILAASLSFTAVTISDSGFIPPDSQGAVGRTQYIACVNGRIRSFSKATGSPDGVIDETTESFFASQVGINDFVSDPKIRFDFLSNSWFIVMISIPEDFLNNKILIAVSTDATITHSTVWDFYSFEANSISPTRPADNFADFPTLGIDKNALYIGINVFDGEEGRSVNCDAYVIPKAELLAGTLIVTVFRDLIDSGTGVGVFTPQGADNFNTNATEGFIIGIDNATFGRLVLLRVFNPGGTPTLSSDIFINVLNTSFPLDVPHKGSNVPLDAIDDRLCNTHVRDQYLYTSHNVGVNHKGVCNTNASKNSRNGCRWYEINISNPAAPTVRQTGTLFNPTSTNTATARFFWIPALMTNIDHKLIIGCSSAGIDRNANAAYAFRKASDPLGTLRAPVLYTSSTTSYNIQGGVQRWGDFSNASLDPSDQRSFWLIEEFCNAKNSWGCRVVKVN